MLNISQKDSVLELLCLLCDRIVQSDSCGSVRLAQGPPGAGKTQTLAVLLDLLLEFRHRAVVCAPSNVAVAEIVHRLIRQRLVHREFADLPGPAASTEACEPLHIFRTSVCLYTILIDAD
jgi:hypothetical protein